MSRVYIKAALLTVALAVSATSLAGTKDRMADKLHVQVANNSTAACRLTFMDVKNGLLLSLPPQAIMAGDSKAFDIKSGMFSGPDIVLEYNCGDNSIRFEAMQFYYSPSIRLVSTKGLMLDYGFVTPSSWYNTPGMINIGIKNSTE